MPIFPHNADITLEAGTPTTFNLQTIFGRSGSPVRWQGADNTYKINTRVFDALDEEIYTVIVTAEGDTVSITADNTDVQAFKVQIWYFDDPTNIYEFNVTAVRPQRRVITDRRQIVESTLCGTGDYYVLPITGFVEGTAPAATVAVERGEMIVRTQGDRQVVEARSDDAIGTVTYGRYVFKLAVRSPATEFADDAPAPDALYIAPGGRIVIQAQTILNNIPDVYKDRAQSGKGILTLGNFNYNIFQGDAVVSAVTGTGDNFPQLHCEGTHTSNNAVSVEVRDNATNTGRFNVRFNVKIMGLNGEDPKQPLQPWADPETDDLNPPPPQTALYQNVPFPPPLRDSQLENERIFTGTFPDRPDGALVRAIVGKIDQEGTATTIGLADPRRLQKIKPEILTGEDERVRSIYDVPRELPDDFYVDWPHALETQE